MKTKTNNSLPIPLVFVATFLVTLAVLLTCPLHESHAQTAPVVEQSNAAAFNVAF